MKDLKLVPESFSQAQGPAKPEELGSSMNPEHLCIQFCQIHNSPANPTPQPAWEEEFNKNIPKTDDALLVSRQHSEDYYFGYKRMEGSEIHTVADWGNVKTFIRSLLKKERTATEHEKSMTDITFAFEAGEKSGRTATLREVMEDVQRLVRTSNQEHTHSSVDCEACAMQKAYGNVYNEIQHKLTSEL